MEFKKGDIVKYTYEYLGMFNIKTQEDKFEILEVRNDLLLIKDYDDKTEFTKKSLNKDWVYKIKK